MYTIFYSNTLFNELASCYAIQIFNYCNNTRHFVLLKLFSSKIQSCFFLSASPSRSYLLIYFTQGRISLPLFITHQLTDVQMYLILFGCSQNQCQVLHIYNVQPTVVYHWWKTWAGAPFYFVRVEQGPSCLCSKSTFPCFFYLLAVFKEFLCLPTVIIY